MARLRVLQGGKEGRGLFEFLFRAAGRAHGGEITDAVIAYRTKEGSWRIEAWGDPWGSRCPDCFRRLSRRRRPERQSQPVPQRL